MNFNALHHQHAPLLIANVWDASSAFAAQQLGYAALGTSSAAIAAMLGYDMPTKIERTDEPPPPLAIYVAGPGGELLPLDDFQQALAGGDDGDQ